MIKNEKKLLVYICVTLEITTEYKFDFLVNYSVCLFNEIGRQHRIMPLADEKGNGTECALHVNNAIYLICSMWF